MEFVFNFRGKISKAATKALSKCKNPADLFVEKTGKTRDEYAKLSLDEKYKFITKAISIAPDVSLTYDFNLNRSKQTINSVYFMPSNHRNH